MRKTPLLAMVACLMVCCAVIAWAQGRKAGLWEVTTTMTFQQSPFPGGNMPGMGAPHTTQVCVTQAQVDKYNGLPPQNQRGDCHMTDFAKTADGFTASMACSGPMDAKGTVESHYTADGHGHTKVHLTGTMHMGPNAAPVEMTSESDSAYKGPDCGSVKPFVENVK
jgi:Protein of unknown function (DUF3617)